MPRPIILIASHRPLVRDPTARHLERHGFEVRLASDGEALARLVMEAQLLLLDLNLPNDGGLVACRRVRAQSAVPIIMWGARNTVRDKVAALGIGADDYVVHTGSLAELVARIRAALRRTGYEHDQDIFFGAIRLRPSTRTVERDDVVLPLTEQEFDLLFCLAQSMGHPLTRVQLLRAVWGDDSGQSEATVTMCMSRLRAKIEQNPRRPRHLKTVRGTGYALVP